jgi:hypothetical protein
MGALRCESRSRVAGALVSVKFDIRGEREDRSPLPDGGVTHASSHLALRDGSPGCIRDAWIWATAARGPESDWSRSAHVVRSGSDSVKAVWSAALTRSSAEIPSSIIALPKKPWIWLS